MTFRINPILRASALEAEIDLFARPPKPWRRRVYQLYNLTPEAIAIVEGAN